MVDVQRRDAGGDKDASLCRRLVKAADGESESGTPTAALVVPSPVRSHLVSPAQGEFRKESQSKTCAS